MSLFGPVRSAEEKQNVEAKAVGIAGAGHVTNRISIAPADTKPVKKSPSPSEATTTGR